MAQLNYDEFVKMTQSNNNRGNQFNQNQGVRVGYFGLSDDGDTALVRFNIASIDDVKVFSRHQVIAGGKRRNISCLKTFEHNNASVCPLCASGDKPSFRSLIPILRYETTEKGVECIPGIWEQPARIRETLKSFTMDYGDLRNYLFKIIRHGKRGDTGTTYTIIPANMNMYDPAVYKPQFELFDNYNPNQFILEKTAAEMQEFLDTGNFPNPFEKKDEGSNDSEPQTKVEHNEQISHNTQQFQQPQQTYYNQQSEGQQVNSQPSDQSYKPRRYTY